MTEYQAIMHWHEWHGWYWNTFVPQRDAANEIWQAMKEGVL